MMGQRTRDGAGLVPGAFPPSALPSATWRSAQQLAGAKARKAVEKVLGSFEAPDGFS